MLKNYPIKINNVAIPFPKEWSENPVKIVNNFETEAGGRKQIITRIGRLNASGTWTVSSRWLKKFLTWRKEPTLSVQIYDAETDAYITHTMSINEDSFQYDLIRDSKLCNNTNGLYELTFELEEF